MKARQLTGKISIAFGLITSLLLLPESARADAVRIGNLQPFACNNSTSQIVDESDNNFAIPGTGKSVSVRNVNGNAGLVYSDFPSSNILQDSQFLLNLRDPRKPHALQISVRGLDRDHLEDVIVRLCFKPQLGLPDLISVDKPLSQFQRDEFLTHSVCLATRGELFGDIAGVPDLRKITIFLKDDAAVSIGVVAFARAQFDSVSPNVLVLTNAGCDAGNRCGNAGLGGLENKFRQRKNRSRERQR